jgi:AsmA-like C-terminal region/AsmA family
VKFFSSKRRIAVAAVLLLLLFLLRPGASRLKARIAASISAGLARPVEVGSVHLRLLPRPGFDLEDLVVYDDPAFGQEPMLRAPEVTADLRLLSLVRGRLEIARLDLTDPSLNLVHGDNGRWNLEALLQHASSVPLAPTAKTKSERRPAFPYIQVSSGRINFKVGQEKKPYALTNADFALWQDSENAWGIRLKAEPVRSDLSLNDTGILRVNGTWQRAAILRDTPVQFTVEWDRPQLGQLTKFLSGDDKGWRGAVQLDLAVTGTPANLQVNGDASVQDFRRYDIPSGPALALAAHCSGRYSSVDHLVHEVACRLPVGDGNLTLKGDVGMPASHRYDLVLNAEGLPASALVALAQRAKRNLPEDLEASGKVRGNLVMRRNGVADEAPRFSGNGEIAGLRLSSPGSKVELDVASIPLKLTADNSTEITRAGKAVGRGERQLQFGPFPLAGGRGAGPMARGWLGVSGYGISLVGEAEVARMLRVAKLFGLPAPSVAADGQAKVDLQIAGIWRGWIGGTPSGANNFAGPQVTGTVKLRGVRAEIRGVDEPIEISSANLQLLRDKVQVTKLSASAAHAQWTGSLELPRGCGAPGACTVSFDLASNQLSLGEVARWMSPQPAPQPWYRLSSNGTSAGDAGGLKFFTSVHAEGRITVNHLVLGGTTADGVTASGAATDRVTADHLSADRVSADRVSADLSLDAGKLRLSDLRGELLGGKHRGEWQGDFSVRPPVYTGKGTLTGVSLRQLASMMHDEWITGTAGGSYEITASGASSSAFWNSAEGTLQFDVRDGLLPHLMLESDGDPLQIERLQGRAHLQAGKIEIKDAGLNSSAGKFQLTGTASFGRELDLKLAGKPDADGIAKTYAIGGTVADPSVKQVASPETQARLKP